MPSRSAQGALALSTSLRSTVQEMARRYSSRMLGKYSMVDLPQIAAPATLAAGIRLLVPVSMDYFDDCGKTHRYFEASVLEHLTDPHPLQDPGRSKKRRATGGATCARSSSRRSASQPATILASAHYTEYSALDN